nr:PREDICTED: GPI ethanolamine phosphate transferase 2 [Bemisia tabaci]
MELLYYIFVSVTALVTFLASFFHFSPSALDSSTSLGNPPSSVENLYLKSFSLTNSSLYHPVVDKVVLMVVDSLRYDFLGDKLLLDRTYMPYVSSLLRNDETSCITKATASPPTVTMPRIKAITTGMAPTYIDIIRNLNATHVNDDNILLRARNHGLKLAFYGDDTWLKMFPGYFQRSEGVTSFYVSDYTEVDVNVTRNVVEELKNDDWNILILHYLGLDHIGHVHGAFSDLIPEKLKEMDYVFQLIHDHLTEKRRKTKKSFLMILCGDHGMKDQGGHGGASADETTVPFVTVGLPCSSEEKNAITQLDIVPTLSVLMGLPIPLKSSGNLALNLLRSLSTKQLLFSLFYNNELLAQKYAKLRRLSIEDECYKDYLAAKDSYTKWSQSTGANTDALKPNSILLLAKSSKCMSSVIIASATTFDLPSMLFAIGLSVQVTVLLFFRPDLKTTSVLGILVFGFLAAATLLLLGNMFVCESHSATSLCTNSISSFFLLLVFCVNCTLLGLGRAQFSSQKLNLRNRLLAFLSFGTCLHLVSVISSSFIEEEHQIWYYLTPSFVSLLLLCVSNSRKNLIQLIITLCMFRFFRKLNSTGDKWASEVDIGDILQENRMFLSGFTFLSLFFNSLCLIWIRIKFYASKLPSILHLVLLPILATIHFTFQMIVNNLNPFFNLSDHYRDDDISFLSALIAWLYWIVSIVILAEDIIKLYISRNQITRLETWSEVFRIMLMSWLFSIGLLQKPHNIILIPVFVFVCHIIQKTLFDLYESSELILCIIHHWLGLLFYFYQGNSNSLATIDVSAGYVGLTHFNFAHVGFQICVSLSAYPILSYILLLNYLIRTSNCTQSFLRKIRRANNVLMTIQIIHLTFFLFVITLMRYHLFIWSVFSPKLLYLSYHTSVFFVLVTVFEAIYLVLEYNV